MDLMGMLGNVLGGMNQQDDDQVNGAFDQFAQNAPQGDLASALMGAFGSNQTPEFGNMLGSLFAQSGGQERAGLLNTLLATAGPAVLAQVLGGRGLDLGALLGGQQQFTPETANRVPADALEELGARTGGNGSSLIEAASNFYAQHPQLVKGLGAAALGIAMNHFMRSRQQG